MNGLLPDWVDVEYLKRCDGDAVAVENEFIVAVIVTLSFRDIS